MVDMMTDKTKRDLAEMPLVDVMADRLRDWDAVTEPHRRDLGAYTRLAGDLLEMVEHAEAGLDARHGCRCGAKRT